MQNSDPQRATERSGGTVRFCTVAFTKTAPAEATTKEGAARCSACNIQYILTRRREPVYTKYGFTRCRATLGGIRAPAPTWSRVAPQRVGASNSQLAGGMETASYPSTMRDECITLHTTAPAEGSGLFRSIEPDFHLGLTPRSKVLLYSYLRPPSNPIPNLDIKTSVTSAHSLVTGFGLWIALQ
jgi:hypothetical protein